MVYLYPFVVCCIELFFMMTAFSHFWQISHLDSKIKRCSIAWNESRTLRYCLGFILLQILISKQSFQSQ